MVAGSSTKAALTFPDGSVTRLDSGTEVLVKAVDKNADGTTTVSLSQSVGKTWSSVKKLVGLAKFNVSGPNNATAEVRGTEFAVIIVVQPDGSKVVHLDVYSGAVDASSQQTTVSLAGGQGTIIGPGAAPTPAAPIPPADLQDSWTVFNQTFDVSQGSPVGFSTNTLNQGDTTALTPGATADGSSDLDFTLGWPGSTFELMVFAPDGTEFSRNSSSTPPVAIVVHHAAAGAWSYKVHDIASNPSDVAKPVKSTAGSTKSMPT